MKTPISAHFLVILVAMSVFATLANAAESPSIEEIEKATDGLTSQLKKDEVVGQAWLDQHADAAFPQLARLIEQGDPKKQYRAATAATILLSPWARSIARGRAHAGQIDLFLPCRPTDRPVNERHAALIRAAALRALRVALEKSRKAVVSPNNRMPSYPGWENMKLGGALCECLAEVGDAEAANEIAALIAVEMNRYRNADLMYCLQTIHGLPRSYRTGGICGNSMPEEFRRYDEAETTRCNTAKGLLIAWHKEHARQAFPQRVEAALDAWDKELKKESTFAYFGDYPPWTTQTQFTSLIRLGKPALEAIRNRITPDKKFWHRGTYAVAVAAIAGEVDKPVVEDLFKRSHFEQGLACEIVAAAGSKDWSEQLTRVQQGYGGPSNKASSTLAVVHRIDAIPFLTRAHKENYTAPYLIKGLRVLGE